MSNVSLKAANASRWANAKITRGSELSVVAKRLVASKARYEAVSKQTGVPWFVIAVIHQRESSGKFTGVLHNGQAIIGTGKKTTIVPKGRGPFSTWEESAIDALRNCGPYAAKNTDWSIGGTLALLERYNGLGYANRGLPSPYIWSGTDQYKKGKYIRDGVFDPNHVDRQLGCAGLIMAMMAIDPTIRIGGQVAVSKEVVAGTAAGGAVVGTVATGAQSGWGVLEWAVAIGALILIGAAGYAAYRWYQSRRASKAGEEAVVAALAEPATKPKRAPATRKSPAKRKAVTKKKTPAKKRAA